MKRGIKIGEKKKMKDLWKLVLQIAVIIAYCIAIAKLFGNQIDRIEGLCMMCVADHVSLRY